MRKDLVKRIVVRAPNWIGDAVMCTPALLALRDLFPFSEITLLARPPVADLLTGLPDGSGPGARWDRWTARLDF